MLDAAIVAPALTGLTHGAPPEVQLKVPKAVHAPPTASQSLGSATKGADTEFGSENKMSDVGPGSWQHPGL